MLLCPSLPHIDPFVFFCTQSVNVSIGTPSRREPVEFYYDVTNKQLLLDDNGRPGKVATENKVYSPVIDGYGVTFSRAVAFSRGSDAA